MVDKPMDKKLPGDDASSQGGAVSAAKEKSASLFAPVSMEAHIAPEAPKQEAQPENGKPYTTGDLGSHSSQAMMDINRHLWEESKHAAWNEGPQGRFAIRLFSRGLMGAAFFTAGGLLTGKWMRGKSEYNPLASLSEQKNPLRVIAKIIDSTLGKGIEHTVGAIAGKEAGMAAVRFRPTRYSNFGKMRGRSLGDETVSITFDFFCASVGDAWGRDIAGWIDPNVKKEWIKQDGSWDIPKALNQALKSVTRYVTYNGGEDWAVAIPYAYFMKGQRHLINRASPGFSHDFDRQMNGGSFKMHNDRIVGNFNKEGMLDLQSRFTAYNIGTLMYREIYDHVGNIIKGKQSSLYGAPDADKSKHSVFDNIADAGKWVARSAVKGAIIMTPSVPFFWITRTPQTKHRGIFIDPERGTLGLPPQPGERTGNTLHANTPVSSASAAVDYWDYQYKPHEPNLAKHGNTSGRTTIGKVNPQLVGREFDAHAQTFGPVDAAFNSIGKANHYMAHTATVPGQFIDRHLGGITRPVKKILGINEHDAGRFVRPMTYASIAYTPYMYAKAEFANLWDNGKMDLATERMIDGAFKLNWGEFKKGAGEVYKAVTYQKFDPEREKEAQRRMLIDTSPPDVFLQTQAEQVADKHDLAPNWRERVISGAPPKSADAPQKHSELVKAKGGDGAALDDYKKAKPSRPAEQLAEREAMRKALEELHPPTNSIN